MTVRGIHNGAMTINGRFGGMLNGTATVPAGATAEIAGMINGALIVERGAFVRISGMVNGAILDRGGEIEVTGMVHPQRA